VGSEGFGGAFDEAIRGRAQALFVVDDVLITAHKAVFSPCREAFAAPGEERVLTPFPLFPRALCGGG
jgi:hypothetical protein